MCWGLGPVLAAAYGFCITAYMLENSLHQEKKYSKVYVQKNLIEYRTSKKGRLADIDACREKRDFSAQLADCTSIMLGFPAILNGVFSALLCNYFIDSPKDLSTFPCLHEALLHLILMLIVGDFFLYW